MYDIVKCKNTGEHSSGSSLSFCTHFLEKSIKTFHNKFLLTLELKIYTFIICHLHRYQKLLPRPLRGVGRRINIYRKSLTNVMEKNLVLNLGFPQQHCRLDVFCFTSCTYSSQVQKLTVAPDHTQCHVHTWQDYPGRGIGPSQKSLHTTHNINKRQISMPPAKFEPAFPTNDQPPTCALGRAANGIGDQWNNYGKFSGDV